MTAAQKVVITGGASGIGLTLARRFLARGDQVALCDADPEALAQVRQSFPEVIAAQADVTDEAAIGAFLAQIETQWGQVDVVCSNAGSSGPAGPIEDLAFDDWQACIGVNLHGAFLTCRWVVWLSAAFSLCRGQMGLDRVDQDFGDGVGAIWGAGQCDLSRRG